jgi:two-component system sensor histidine kinase AgrC
MTSNDFVLEALHKLKVYEVKGILTAKLMVAQGLGTNFNVAFEANEDIDNIPMDSVALVRALGIILDNAIEALEGLGYGNLWVGCFKWEDGVYFIVQNTCSPDLPEFSRLWDVGFSTKGDGRGLGLLNLLEIVDALPNIALETRVVEDSFIQKLTITNQ